MTNPENNFKQKLYDLETPLGSNVSFEKVMSMRAKRPSGGVWWKPTLLVVATLSAVSVAAFFLGHHTNSSNAGDAKDQGLVANTQNNPAARNESVIEKNTSESSNYQQDRGNGGKSKINNQSNNSSNGFQSNNEKKDYNKKPIISANTNSSNKKEISENKREKETSNSEDGAFYFKDAFGLFGGLNPRGISAHHHRHAFKNGNRLNEFVRELKQKASSPWSFEAMTANGGYNYQDFKKGDNFSVRGINRFGQYNLSALFDLGKGLSLAAGIGYNENIGTGEWRKIQSVNQMYTSSHVVRIVQPGLPDIYKTVHDTTFSPREEVTSGTINYSLSKISIPLGFRYHFGDGRLLWRFSGTIAPGLLTSNSGNIFNRTNSNRLDVATNHALTFDTRIAFGIYLPVSPKLSFVAEPTAQYQAVMGKTWNGYNKFVAGIGVGLVFKP